MLSANHANVQGFVPPARNTCVHQAAVNIYTALGKHIGHVGGFIIFIAPEKHTGITHTVNLKAYTQ